MKRKSSKTAVTPAIHEDELAVVQLSEDLHADAAAAATVAAKPVKEPKPIPSADEALATAKATGRAEYAHVLRVVEQTPTGEPKRVVIACQDPQTKFVGTEQVSVCEGEREIAVQDLFQVRCCAACADRKVRKARRDRAKRKNKALRQAIKAAKQG